MKEGFVMSIKIVQRLRQHRRIHTAASIQETGTMRQETGFGSLHRRRSVVQKRAARGSSQNKQITIACLRVNSEGSDTSS